jgi:CheY-like chemotaxis protein
MAKERILENSLAIQMIVQRLYLANDKVTLAFHEGRDEFQILSCEAEQFYAAMQPKQFSEWGLAKGEKLSMNLADRGFNYEAVVECQGPGEVENVKCCLLTMPRTLRRSDSHRLADFVPDSAPVCTFSNSRSALMDAQVKGFGMDGMELSFKDPRQNLREALRMDEVATLEVPLADNLKLRAPAKVAYYGDTYVGLKFTENADQALMGQYRSWLENQEKLQAQRDRESFLAGENRRAARTSKGPDLPGVRIWVDRNPAILVITEKEEVVRRLAEGLGRKFGIFSLDYITGKVRSYLGAHGGEAPNWGRVRMIVIHNQLRLASPLELCKQIMEQESCPLPVVLAGTDEDLDLKRNRALAAGAVDYVPIEPFKILAVLRKMDETIKMFEG